MEQKRHNMIELFFYLENNSKGQTSKIIRSLQYHIDRHKNKESVDADGLVDTLEAPIPKDTGITSGVNTVKDVWLEAEIPKPILLHQVGLLMYFSAA